MKAWCIGGLGYSVAEGRMVKVRSGVDICCCSMSIRWNKSTQTFRKTSVSQFLTNLDISLTLLSEIVTNHTSNVDEVGSCSHTITKKKYLEFVMFSSIIKSWDLILNF